MNGMVKYALLDRSEIREILPLLLLYAQLNETISSGVYAT